MKLQSQINYKPIPFECDGATWYMKKLTVPEVKKLQTEFGKLTQDAEDMTPLMVLFTDVLVGEDGEQFDEVKEGISFDELCAMIPITTLQNLAESVTNIISGNTEGN